MSDKLNEILDQSVKLVKNADAIAKIYLPPILGQQINQIKFSYHYYHH